MSTVYRTLPPKKQNAPFRTDGRRVIRSGFGSARKRNSRNSGVGNTDDRQKSPVLCNGTRGDVTHPDVVDRRRHDLDVGAEPARTGRADQAWRHAAVCHAQFRTTREVSEAMAMAQKATLFRGQSLQVDQSPADQTGGLMSQ
jgi:hypothetical protein